METSGESSKWKCTPRKLTISSLFIILFVGFVVAFAYILDSPAAKRMRAGSQSDEEIDVIVVNDIDELEVTIVPSKIPTLSPVKNPNTSIGPTVIAVSDEIMNTIGSPTFGPRITNRPTGTSITDFLMTLPAGPERTTGSTTKPDVISSEKDLTNDKPFVVLNPNTRQKHKKTWKGAKYEKTWQKEDETPEMITIPSGQKNTKSVSGTSNMEGGKTNDAKATKVLKQMKSKSEKSGKNVDDDKTTKESKFEKKGRGFSRAAPVNANRIIIY